MCTCAICNVFPNKKATGLTLGCFFKAVDLFMDRFVKAFTAFVSSSETLPRNALRIPLLTKTCLILCGLRSISLRSLLSDCASGCQMPPPIHTLAGIPRVLCSFQDRVHAQHGRSKNPDRKKPVATQWPCRCSLGRLCWWRWYTKPRVRAHSHAVHLRHTHTPPQQNHNHPRVDPLLRHL
jgi:hypothetical protein